MNRVDEFLSRTPNVDKSWHCPWFWLILALCLNGVFFGVLAATTQDTDLGWAAVTVGALLATHIASIRTLGEHSC